MVSNSITSESRGALNGTGQTLGSLGRMLGPVYAGIIFSWSLENGLPFPVDYHFLFLLLGLTVFIIFLVSLLVPTSIDQRMSEEVEVDLGDEEQGEEEDDE
jgi:MFS family permease